MASARRLRMPISLRLRPGSEARGAPDHSGTHSFAYGELAGSGLLEDTQPPVAAYAAIWAESPA